MIRHPWADFRETSPHDAICSELEMCMGIPWESHGNGNTNMPKMGMGMGRVHETMGMGRATFSCVPKFPSVDSMRMQANEIL